MQEETIGKSFYNLKIRKTLLNMTQKTKAIQEKIHLDYIN